MIAVNLLPRTRRGRMRKTEGFFRSDRCQACGTNCWRMRTSTTRREGREYRYTKPQCVRCTLESQRRSQAKYKEKTAAYQRTEEARAVRKIARDKCRAKNGERYRLNALGRARRDIVERPEAYLFRGARSRAADKGLPFDLTEADIVIPAECPLLGIALLQVPAKGKRAPNSPTVDRIDNSRGYVRGNVWIISWRANRLKSDATLEELQRIARRLGERCLSGE